MISSGLYVLSTITLHDRTAALSTGGVGLGLRGTFLNFGETHFENLACSRLSQEKGEREHSVITDQR